MFLISRGREYQIRNVLLLTCGIRRVNEPEEERSCLMNRGEKANSVDSLYSMRVWIGSQ